MSWLALFDGFEGPHPRLPEVGPVRPHESEYRAAVWLAEHHVGLTFSSVVPDDSRPVVAEFSPSDGAERNVEILSEEVDIEVTAELICGRCTRMYSKVEGAFSVTSFDYLMEDLAKSADEAGWRVLRNSRRILCPTCAAPDDQGPKLF